MLYPFNWLSLLQKVIIMTPIDIIPTPATLKDILDDILFGDFVFDSDDDDTIEDEGGESIMEQLESDEEIDEEINEEINEEVDETFNDRLLEDYLQNIVDQTETPTSSSSSSNLIFESMFYVPRRLFPMDVSEESESSDESD